MFIGKVMRGAIVFYYRMRLGRVGRNFRIGLGSTILNPSLVTIGDDVYLGPGTQITSPTSVVIGDRVMFGPQVMLIGGDHDLSNTEIPLRFAPAPPNPPPIVIEDDAWIGARVTILKGVRIGRGAVVGAASVVTNDIPPLAIAVGNPCRVVRFRAVPASIQGTVESVDERAPRS
jgi:maltose O-acetyltransferase